MTTDLKQTLGRQVKAAREAKRLTQEQLAGLVERTPEALSNIERGHSVPSLDTLEKLSIHLDVPIAEFFEQAKAMEGQSPRRVGLETDARQVIKRLSDMNLEVALKQLKALADSQK
ncbi:helix-turn-helix transcriptional regulator [Thalassospiraceae bacterium LMO-SO8]|nr:helix-turn-helix domain-containing protein [Alphaproteobacteria bacterium LMO-S08]WND77371.1 helix-turn-helix transcriptional regulator [Thalassospiraceae bacterium LMO-SO8]